MQLAQFLEELNIDLDRCIARIEPLKKLSAQQFNAITPAHNWSVGQQIEHLLLSHEKQVEQLRGVLSILPDYRGEELRFSWIGKFIAKAAGPAGNGPVPKPFVPGAGPFAVAILDRLLTTVASLKQIIPQLYAKDLCAKKIPSPGGALIRYYWSDVLNILPGHLDRHLNQIDSITRHPSFPAEK